MPVAKSEATSAAAEAAAAARTAISGRRPKPAAPQVTLGQQRPQLQHCRRCPVAGCGGGPLSGSANLTPQHHHQQQQQQQQQLGKQQRVAAASRSALWMNGRLAARKRHCLRVSKDGQLAASAALAVRAVNNSVSAAATKPRVPSRGSSSVRLPVPMPRRRAVSAASGQKQQQQQQPTEAANNSATPNMRESDKKAATVSRKKSSSKQSQQLPPQEPPEVEEASQDEGVTTTVPENADLVLLNSYSRQLRSRLGLNSFQVPEVKAIEANMNLVKARRHPTQMLKEVERLEDQGVTRMAQIRSQKRIANYLEKAKAMSAKKKKKDEEPQEGFVADKYPDWIPFKLRFQRQNSKEAWSAFIERRKELKKALGERAPAVAKPNDKYNEDYIDVWTRSLTVQARPTSILRDIVRPVFTRLGLDNRLDFKVTIGCFVGDTRQGGVKLRSLPRTSVEVSGLTPMLSLYERGITEIFISRWPDVCNEFPEGYFDDPTVAPTKPPRDNGDAGDTGSKKKKKQQQQKQQQQKQQSNWANSVSNEFLVRWHLHASQHAAAACDPGNNIEGWLPTGACESA